MKKVIFFLFLLTFFYTSALQLKYDEKKLFFNFGTGIAYDFNFGADFFSKNNTVFFDVPLVFEFDYRFRENISFTSGINIVYNYHQYTSNDFEISKHNMFIDIPLNLKFYPLADREESHYFFYIGVGLFLRTWPVNTYTMSGNNKYYQGNGYYPDNGAIPQGNAYMPINVGTSLSIGNVLKFTDSVGGGVEIYAKYLFLPYLNGYLSDPDSTDNSGRVYLNFWGDTGLKFFLSFNITKDTTQMK